MPVSSTGSRRFFSFFSRRSGSASSGVEPAELAADEVAGGQLADGHPQRRQLAGQVLGVGPGAGRAGAVLLGLHPVAVGLPVLRQQDQRRGVGGLGGEGQVEQDERVGVPAQPDGEDVQRDPDDHDDRLDGQEAAGAEEPGDRPRRTGRPRPGPAAGSRRGCGRAPRGTSSRVSHGGPARASPRAAGGRGRRPRSPRRPGGPASSTTGAATRL